MRERDGRTEPRALERRGAVFSRPTRSVLRRATRHLAVIAGLWLAVGATSAHGSDLARVADLEDSPRPPFDLDQVSASHGSATRTTSVAYTGAHALHLSYAGGSGSAYARAVLEDDAGGFAEGEEFWAGAAIYLKPGYYARKGVYADILRLDSYVYDGGVVRPARKAQYLALASYRDSELYVDAGPEGGSPTHLIGPLPSTDLPEGRWNWVELRIRVSATPGRARTSLMINGSAFGSSALANRVPSHANWNRLRVGLVSAGGSVGAVSADVDRLSISSTELGPRAPAPPAQPGLDLFGAPRWWSIPATGSSR